MKVKAKRVARITPLKNFKDAVLSGKAPAKKAPAKKTAAKKAPPRRHRPEKAPAKKAAAKKAPAKKAPARKTREAALNQRIARVHGPGPSARARSRLRSRVVQPPVRAVELVRIRLPLIAPFRTARSTTTHKEALLVRVVTDDGAGWGEVGAETTPTYAPDTLDTARLVLRDELVPRLFAGAPLDDVRGHHAAKAR